MTSRPGEPPAPPARRSKTCNTARRQYSIVAALAAAGISQEVYGTGSIRDYSDRGRYDVAVSKIVVKQYSSGQWRTKYAVTDYDGWHASYDEIDNAVSYRERCWDHHSLRSTALVKWKLQGSSYVHRMWLRSETATC